MKAGAWLPLPLGPGGLPASRTGDLTAGARFTRGRGVSLNSSLPEVLEPCTMWPVILHILSATPWETEATVMGTLIPWSPLKCTSCIDFSVVVNVKGSLGQDPKALKNMPSKCTLNPKQLPQ